MSKPNKWGEIISIKKCIRYPVTEPHHTKQVLSLVTCLSSALLKSQAIFLAWFSFYAADKKHTVKKIIIIITEIPSNVKALTSSVSHGPPQHKMTPRRDQECPPAGLVGSGKGKTILGRVSSRWSLCPIRYSPWWVSIRAPPWLTMRVGGAP